MFCEEVSFHGGSYRVLPGINEHATFILKRILEPLYFHRDEFPDREYVQSRTRLIRGTLALSERICARLTSRETHRLNGVSRKISLIPDGAMLTTAKERGSFQPRGFRSLARKSGSAY